MDEVTYAEVNLDQYAENFQNVQTAVGPRVGICALAKANAYGHGMVEISRCAEKLGAKMIAVATVEEGAVLRAAGIKAPVLALNAVLPQSISAAVQNDIALTVFSEQNAKDILAAARELGKCAVVHIQFDTGMNRVGAGTIEELKSILAFIKDNKEIVLKGLYTHFAQSDESGHLFADEQYARFEQAVALTKNFGFTPILHASNSGGVLNLPYARLDMVRPGLMLYGYYPNKNMQKTIEVSPVMGVYTHIVQIRTIEAGVSVGYDRTWRSKRKTKIAAVPIGYGDGYKRLLSNRGQAIVAGVKVPVIGRVSMDLTVLDITGVPKANVGDKVTLLGGEGGVRITADDMAGWAETISYEILLSFSQRVPRVYIENGVRI